MTFVQVGILTLDLKLVIAYAALQIMVEVHGAAVPWRLGVGVWSCCCLGQTVVAARAEAAVLDHTSCWC